MSTPKVSPLFSPAYLSRLRQLSQHFMRPEDEPARPASVGRNRSRAAPEDGRMKGGDKTAPNSSDGSDECKNSRSSSRLRPCEDWDVNCEGVKSCGTGWLP
ncbi:hypothetical protein JCM6882_006065 [Rhodosporidiobolus microsporus]